MGSREISLIKRSNRLLWIFSLIKSKEKTLKKQKKQKQNKNNTIINKN